MRGILLLVLLAQGGPTLSGAWVGPLQMTFHAPVKGRGEIPTLVELTQDGQTLTGTWRSLPPNTASGTIRGTIEKPEIVFYTDADAGPSERCQAVVQMKATITRAGIYRLTANQMIPDIRPIKHCEPWPTDLVWMLQRR